MKRIGAFAIIAVVLSCRSQPQESVGRVSLNAVNASYTPIAQSQRGVLEFDLIVRNDGNVPARLGCGMSVDRKDASGIKRVAHGACLAPGSVENDSERDSDIRPRSSDTLRVARNIALAEFDKDATFRAALSVAFGPSFRTGLPFTSNWVKAIEKPEQDIRRLLSNTR